MMTNLLLILGIVLFLLYAIYDQLLMDKLKGQTLLSLPLERQAKLDSYILIALILLPIYQSLQTGISSLTLFLLSIAVLLAIYASFIRFPRLVLKEQGFFFANIYFEYAKIAAINLAQDDKKAEQILVIDLKPKANQRGQRLLVRFRYKTDIEKAVTFFEGKNR